MAEYIEREDLIRRIELSIASWSRDCNSNAPVITRTYQEILNRVKYLPAADVAEVVRCKDCEYCDDTGMSGSWCKHPDNRNPLGCRPDDYCNDGKKG